VPAILQRGEWVLNRQDVAAIRSSAGQPAASSGPRVTVINNGPTEATAVERPDGSVEVIVEALESRMGERAKRGKGSLYKGITSRADNRGLRGY
jgi:hypothetical protein